VPQGIHTHRWGCWSCGSSVQKNKVKHLEIVRSFSKRTKAGAAGKLFEKHQRSFSKSTKGAVRLFNLENFKTLINFMRTSEKPPLVKKTLMVCRQSPLNRSTGDDEAYVEHIVFSCSNERLNLRVLFNVRNHEHVCKDSQGYNNCPPLPKPERWHITDAVCSRPSSDYCALHRFLQLSFCLHQL